jgi:hypothetical protein
VLLRNSCPRKARPTANRAVAEASKRGNASGKKRVRGNRPTGIQPGKSVLAGGCGSAGAAVIGKRQPKEPGVAALATKRPEENAGQDSFFQESFTPRWMDSFTAALWTLHDGNSPDAKLASQTAATYSPASAISSVSFCTPRPVADLARRAPVVPTAYPPPSFCTLTLLSPQETKR